MQTILGSNGQIGHELANELYLNYTKELRLVSRNPQKIHVTDEMISADFLNFEETKEAIKGSEIVYFTVGLPMNTEIIEKQFPIIVKNVVEACELDQSKLVFFDNTYMYPKNSQVQTEETKFDPVGRKSVVRTEMTQYVLDEISSGKLDAVICRAPEFYGPDRTQSFTNYSIFNRIKANKKALIPLRKDVKRSLIYTPDASKAMALIANSPDTYNQTWHLPIASPITYEEMIKLVESIINRPVAYKVMKYWQFKLLAHFQPMMKETLEMLPRYDEDNLFSTEKFQNRFPEFEVTSFKEGINRVFNDAGNNK